MTKPVSEAVERHPPFTTLDRVVAVMDTWLNYIGVTFTILLMLMTVVNVTGRYVFNWPLKAYVDIMEMMMVLLVFLCLAYCQMKGGQIRFELFMTRVLKGGRPYHLMEVFNLLLSLVAFGIIAFYSAKSTINAYIVGDSTLTVYLPTWPFRMGAAIGSIALCLRLLVLLIQNVAWAAAGAPAEPTAGPEFEA
ncbi:MAG: TRAP transporter small permease [Chloroflexota bacterium]